MFVFNILLQYVYCMYHKFKSFICTDIVVALRRRCYFILEGSPICSVLNEALWDMEWPSACWDLWIRSTLTLDLRYLQNLTAVSQTRQSVPNVSKPDLHNNKDNIKTRHYWPFVSRIDQWPMDSPHKGSVMTSPWGIHSSPSTRLGYLWSNGSWCPVAIATIPVRSHHSRLIPICNAFLFNVAIVVLFPY